MAGKAKTLKDLNDQITSVSMTMLERRIGDTIMATYLREMDSMYEKQLKSKLGTVSIPSLQLFATMANGLKGRLIDLYNQKMSRVKGFDTISDDIKFAQGALMDGLCYVYELETGKVTLATMNLDILCDLDVEFDMQKQIIEKNKKGIIKAYRIDVEYLNGDKEFTFKAVNARNYDIDEHKPDTDETKKFVLVPYIAGVRLMKMCEGLLNKGSVLRIRQSNEGVVKIRFLTNNINILKEYCDDPCAAEAVKGSYFPLKGFFYVPVVGAPSTTAMVSRVDVFNIDNIRVIKSKDQIEQAGIKKPTNPVRDLIGERYFVSTMLQLKGKDLEAFSDMLKKLSYQGKLIKNPEMVDASELRSYLHSVTPAAVEKAYRLTGIVEKINRSMEYIGSTCRPMTKEELDNIERTLKNNICRFIIRKSECSLGSVFATNDRHLLGGLYGKGYFGIYEGFSARFARLESFLEEMFEDVREDVDNEGAYFEGSPLWEAASYNISEDVRFPFNKEIFEDLVEMARAYQSDGVHAFIRHAKAFFAELCGVDLKRSEAASEAAAKNKEKGVIQCRSIAAYIDEKGKVVDYFKNLSLDKIVSAMVIE